MKDLYYNPNNIEFRIVSSKAISQFKLNQAFDFNELVNNPNFKFSSESREILLLSYDVWFKFIMKLERIFVKTPHNNKLISSEIHDHIMSLFEDNITVIYDIMDEYPLFFDEKIAGIVKQTNRLFNEFIRRQIQNSLDTTIYIAFPSITNAISNALNNLLFQLQEIEYLISSELKANAFLSYSEECSELNLIGYYPLLERAKIYKEAFDVSEFDIKNYTGEDIRDMVDAAFLQSPYTIRNILDVSSLENVKN